MMDEQSQIVLQDPILRGQEAERILTSPVWLEAWGQMEVAIVQGWKDAPMRDSDGMAELKRMHKTLTSLRANLESAMQNGKIERANQERNLRERAADWFKRVA